MTINAEPLKVLQT